MRIVNFYTTDKTVIFRRLKYLQMNYNGITMPNKKETIISMHDTNINGYRKVVLEYENRKDIFTLTLRDYYAKVE